MSRELQTSAGRPPIVRRVGAGLVLVAGVALAVHFIIGLVITVFWIALAVAAIAAILWAVNTLL